MTEGDALAAAVTVTQQVVYGYGVAGAHLTGRDRRAARRALDAHLTRRDRLAGLLTRVGSSPPVASPAYALPFPVTDAVSARRLCAGLEDGCAGAAWDLVAAAGAGTAARVLGVTWLADAATAAATWRDGSPSPALPGQPR
jgi:hypothetical protein